MKTKYQQPKLRAIQLDTEDSLMLTVSNKEVNTAQPDFEQRSQQKDGDLWGNESIWQ